jgi:hypothetical protein
VIVGRLAAAARAVVAEFSDSKILSLITHAAQIAAQRTSLTDAQYQQTVSAIQTDARNIINNSKLIDLPSDLKPLFTDGPYGNALPSKLAQTLLLGVTYDKVSSMASAELNLYSEAGARLLGNLNNMLGAFKALSLDDIVVPDGTISFDLLVPRSAFDNRASEFIKINSSFVDILSYIEELAGGDNLGPKLVYTSTTDPVTGFAVIMVAATPILLFYEKILDVAKKQIDLLKAVKSMRDMFPGVSLPQEVSVDDKVKQLTRQGIEEAVSDVVESVGVKVDESRKSEITNAIAIRSTTLVTAVANGARVSISLESQLNIEQDFSDNPLDLEKIKSILANTRPLEQTVSDSLKLLDQNVPLLEHTTPS